MVLDKNTRISIGLVLAVCSFIFWMNSKFEIINTRLLRIEILSEQGRVNTFTSRNMSSWIMELKNQNPELNIPGLK